MRIVREGAIAYVLDAAGKSRIAPEPDPALLARHAALPPLALAFAAAAARLAVVERVICQQDADCITLWTIVNEASGEERYQIYNIQWDVLRRFEGQAADFRLIDRAEYAIDDWPEWRADAFVLEVGHADAATELDPHLPGVHARAFNGSL